MTHTAKSFGSTFKHALLEINDKKSKKKQEYGQQGFSEGWVEFLDKKQAKAVVQMLNCQRIGRSFSLHAHKRTP